MKGLWVFSLPFWLLSCWLPAASAEEGGPEAFLKHLPELEGTHAYAQYRSRPENELSKMIYLIDRFSETDAEILYSGKTFKTGAVARIARWFVKTRYTQSDRAESWINKWCHRTIPEGEMIWVRYQGGRYFSARDILLADLETLENVTFSHKEGGIPLASDPTRLPPSISTSPAPAPLEIAAALPQVLAVAAQN